MTQSEYLLLGLCLIPTAILVGAAWLDRRYGIFSPFVLMIPTFFTSQFLRTYAHIMGQDQSRPDMHFGGLFDTELITTVLWIIGFALFFSLGYFTPARKRSDEVIGRDGRSYRAQNILLFTMIGCAIISVVVWIYLSSVGMKELELGNLSTKRKVELAGGERASSGGIYLFLAQFAYANVIVLSAVWWQHLRARRSMLVIMAIGLSILTFSATGFLTSSRRAILFAILPILTIGYFERRISTRTLVVGIAVLFCTFNLLYVLRSVASKGLTLQEIPAEIFSVEPFTRTADGPELSKLTRIRHHYHSPREWEWGQTFMNACLETVPRAIWPEKPNFSLGYKITREVYGREAGRGVGGSTASGLGELLINFGPVGLLVGGLAMGWITGLFMTNFFPSANSSVSQTTAFLALHPVISLHVYLNSISAASIIGILAIAQCAVVLSFYSLFAPRPLKSQNLGSTPGGRYHSGS